MKKYEGIRYDFCPTSYWDDISVEQAVLRGVKGKHRRQLLSKALAEGKFEKISEEIQSAEISNELRDQLGQIHPSLMGGEYLPSYEREETEIARIELESTTSDVISIRARWEDGQIHYRVVDEYATEFGCKPDRSDCPLSLNEFIRFIDAISCQDLWGPFSLAYNELNADGGTKRRRLRYFTSIDSDVYVQLSGHFERVFEAWVAEGEAEAGGDDDE
ncbi:MAG: hypothetical protein EXS25_03225 [Pedosphaera sp.]|nr:hypothetical protein [Pedosphaera sp.]